MLGATGGTVKIHHIQQDIWIEKLFQVAIMTLCAVSVDRYNVIVYPLNPSRSTTSMRSKLMILYVWVYSLPFCGKVFLISEFFQLNLSHYIKVVPFLEIWGVGGYIPEGFLTACSFDYLDSSPSNYWFIFVYAIVRVWYVVYREHMRSFLLHSSHRLHIFYLWS